MKRIFVLLIMSSILLSACSSKQASAPSGEFSADDLGVNLSGKSYFLREDSKPLLDALGSDFEFSEIVSCVYDGKDKTYAYDGIIVNTVPVDGKDITEMITITNNKYATLRGVSVGAKLEDIIKAYGENYFDDGYITYSLTGDINDIQAERIQFEFNGESVGRIFIYSPSY